MKFIKNFESLSGEMSLEDDLKSVVESYVRIADESEYESFEILLKLRFHEAQSLEIWTQSPGVNNHTSDILQLSDTPKFFNIPIILCQQITKVLTEFALKNPTFIFTFFDCDEEKVRFEASSAANIDDRVVQLYSQRYREVNKLSMSLHGCDIQIFIFVADGSNSIKRSVAINDDYVDESLRFAIEKALNVYPGTETEDLKFVAIFKDIFERKSLKALSWKLQQEVTARFDPVKFRRHDHENSIKFCKDELQDHGDQDDFNSAKQLDLEPAPIIDLTEFSQQNDENMNFLEVIRDDDYQGNEDFYKVCGSDGMSVDELDGEEYDRLTFYTPPIDEKLLQKFLTDDQRCLKKETIEGQCDIENSQNCVSNKVKHADFNLCRDPESPPKFTIVFLDDDDDDDDDDEDDNTAQLPEDIDTNGVITGDQPVINVSEYYDASKAYINFITEKSEVDGKKVERPFECKKCGKSFGTRSIIKIHINAVHLKIKPHECSLCPLNFYKKLLLKKHMNSHLGIKDHVCTICQKAFFKAGLLRHHIKIFHNNNDSKDYNKINASKDYNDFITEKSEVDGKKVELPFECKECGKSFRTRTHVKVHINVIHFKIKAFECSLCPLKFSSKIHLKKHTNNRHDNKMNVLSASKDYKDLITEKSEVDGKKLKRPFECKECGKLFKTRQEIKVHINAGHLNIRPFECLQCGKSFHSRGNLKVHLTTHMKKHMNDPHDNKLNVLNASKAYINFITEKSEVDGKKVERPFECKECGKSFKTRPEIKAHINAVHLKIKPFECSLCLLKFSFKNQLKSHVLNRHGNNMNPLQ